MLSLFLIAAIVPTMGEDVAGGEAALDRLRGQLAGMKSLRVKGTYRSVEAGGLWAQSPALAEPVFDPEGVLREYDVWFEPPRQAETWTESTFHAGRPDKPTTTSTYFDGSVYTYLRRDERNGLRTKGGGMVVPTATSPLHGVGLCFPETFSTSLADVLAERSRVRIEQQTDGEWMAEVKGLPDGLRLRGWGPEAARSLVVRVWFTANPPTIRRWAYYTRQTSQKHSEEMYGRPIPALAMAGHDLHFGFVNTDFQPSIDEGSGQNVQMPRRIFCGNGNYTGMMSIHEIVVNPRPTNETFLPPLPAGYAITLPGESKDGPVVAGSRGEQVRVTDISQQAKDLLASGGEQLRSPPDRNWVWWVIMLLALSVCGVVGWRLLRKRRSS